MDSLVLSGGRGRRMLWPRSGSSGSGLPVNLDTIIIYCHSCCVVSLSVPLFSLQYCMKQNVHSCLENQCPSVYGLQCKTKSNLWIPGKGIAGPQTQFLHSCVCKRFIYSHAGSGPHIWVQQNRQTNPGNIEISRRHMSVEIRRQNIIILFCFGNNEAAQFHFWEYLNGNHTFILDSHRPFICSVYLFFSMLYWMK